MAKTYGKLPSEVARLQESNPHFLNAYDRLVFYIGETEDQKEQQEEYEFFIELAKMLISGIRGVPLQ